MKTFNVAIIGCGTICKSAHAPSYAKNPAAHVTYLCDLIPEKAQAVKDANGFTDAQIVTDYKKLLKKKDIDCVSVCLPNYLHAPVSIDFLKNGKDVICEKPISVSVKNALKMKETADKYGRMLNIGVVNRYNTYVNELRKLVASGELGDLYHIYCSFRAFRSIPGMGGWFTTKDLSGGGCLLDWGVHYIDLILYIIGNPVIQTVSGKAFCELGRDMKNYVFESMWAGPPNYDGVYDVDDSVTGFIRTAGPTLTINGAWAQNIPDGSGFIEFMGNKGGAKLRYGGSFDLTVQKDGKLITTTPEFTPCDMFYEEMNDFLSSCETRMKSRNNIDYVLVTQKALNGIYDSSEKGKEVIVNK